MSSSPFINQQLKDYIIKNQIESKINGMLNNILKKQPQDPYAALAIMVQQQSSPDVTLLDIKAYEALNSDGVITIQIEFKVEFLAKQIVVNTEMGFLRSSENQQNILYDEDQNRYGGKGMLKACELINNEILPQIQNQFLGNQKKIDEILNKIYLQHNYVNIIQPISLQLPKIISMVKNEPLYEVLRQNYQVQVSISKPQIYIPMLVTNGKCKVVKFFIIFYQQSQDIIKDIYNLTAGVKKIITSGKGGELSLKISPEGSFICVSDTIMDNIKLLEDSIISCGLKDICKIGLTFQGDQMWQNDKQKYEVEGPKQLFDSDQMIDYYVKLCADKPIIAYIEDPLVTSDSINYQKILQKFQTNNVKISSKKVFDANPLIPIQQALFKLQDFKYFTNLYDTWKALNFKDIPTQFILEGNYNETLDFSFVDIAFAFGMIISIAPPSKFERIQALNRYLQICALIELN